MLDLLIRGAAIVDGTGAPGSPATSACATGASSRSATSTRPPEPHASTPTGSWSRPGSSTSTRTTTCRLLWDPALTPSPLHGVTTVIGGNCGFSIAPLVPDAVDYVMQMMARVEGMPLASLEAGPAWDWQSFGEWLDRIDGRLGGQRRLPRGPLDHAPRASWATTPTHAAATPEQIAAMVALLHESLPSRRARVLVVARRGAQRRRRRAGAVTLRATRRVPRPRRAVRDHAGTSLEFIPAMGEISDERIALMTDMSFAADRPLNWNLLGSVSPTPVFAQQLTSSDHAAAHGARVVALALPDVMRLRSSRMLQAMPGWGEVIALPDAERRARASQDAAVRDRLRDRARRRDLAGGRRG